MNNDLYLLESIETREPYPLPDIYAIEIPSLETVLAGVDALPAYSLLLGMCDDGLPLVLDLTEPAAGPFLIAGDDRQANSALLYGIMTSATRANTEEEVVLHLISPQVDELVALHQQPDFRIGLQPGRPEVEVMVEELVNFVRQRQTSGELQPIHILAIDQLDRLIDALCDQGQARLSWLLEQGPEAGLWIIAAIQSQTVEKLQSPILERFPSRMVGRVQSPPMARFFSGLSRAELAGRLEEGQFFVRAGQETCTIWPLQTEA